MRLLNVSTRQLEHFNSEHDVPGGYAILSHTWGEEEVTYEDLPCGKSAPQKHGYRKVEFACLQTLEDDLSYVWIDTCECTNMIFVGDMPALELPWT